MITATAMIDGARMYAAAADVINDRYPNALHVLSHTIGMAIELALKAFLVQHGMNEQAIRRLGHDLSAILTEAERRGFESTGSRRYRLAVLGHNYGERIFVYPEETLLTVINPGSLREVADGIINEAFQQIVNAGVVPCDAPGLVVRSSYPDDTDPSAWDQARSTGVERLTGG